MKISHKIMITLIAAVTVSLMFCVAGLAASGVVNVDVLNVREYPSYEAKVLSTITGGTRVDIISSNDGWHEINFNGYSAYVVAQYIDIQEEQSVQTEEYTYENIDPLYGGITYNEVWYGRVTAGVLNLRDNGSYDAGIIRQVYRGTKVEVRGEKGLFYRIENGEWDVYVAKEYIERISYEEFSAAAPSGGNEIVEIAMRYLGTPYKYGGASPSGFDCSGFTSYVYSQVGISLNRTASGQASNGVWVAKSDLAPGDIVLFGPYSGSGIGHAGIYVGDGNMIHSPNSGKTVCIESIYSNYYNSRYVQARRVL